MKISIKKDRLIKSVQDVMKAITSRTTIPILTGIKIVATEKGVTFTGSDSDISIESFIPREEEGDEIIELKQTGAVVLQAKLFGELVKKLPGDYVSIEVKQRLETVVRSGKSTFNLMGLDAEEYPRLPQIKVEDVIRLPIDTLKAAIKQTAFAVSTSETRPILTGVHWEVHDHELNSVATDSHRLSSKKVKVEMETPEENYNITIPGKSLTELSKILPEHEKMVEIVITGNQILFKTNYVLFYSRLLEGNYPDTSRLIPQEGNTRMTLKTKEFLQAIDRASLLAREGKNNVVKLSTLDNKGIEISSNTPEVGKVVEEIHNIEIEGEEIKITFSAKYMMDALKTIEAEDIMISFVGAMRPFVLRPIEDDSALQLILPVRTY